MFQHVELYVHRLVDIIFVVKLYEHWLIYAEEGNQLYKLQPEPKTVPEFIDAIKLIWSVLREKAIDNTAKVYHKRL